MKKKLIALAVAGALAAPVVASAQGTNVTIFGRVQAEYSLVDSGAPGNHSQGALQDNARSSRWGLQITEDLGRGLKANARMEMGLNTGAGSASTPREQWVGLSHNNWGDVKLGRVQSPFKDFAGGMTIDPFAYTTMQANGAGATMTGSANGMGSGANGFVNSALRFDSITTDGFSFAGLLMPGDSASNDPRNATGAQAPGGLGSTGMTGGRDGEFDGQAAAKYATSYMGQDITAFGGYSRDNANVNQKAVGLRTEETWRMGATWAYQNLKVVGQYEQIRNAIGTATCTTGASQTANPADTLGSGQCNSAMNMGGDGSIWHVGTNYQYGNTLLVAQGGMTNADATGAGIAGLGAAGARDARSFTIGAIHSLSKRTSLFGGYQRVTMNSAAGAGAGTGLAEATSLNARVGDRNTWTIGMRHNF